MNRTIEVKDGRRWLSGALIPLGPRIERGTRTAEQLYQVEETRDRAIERAARLQAEIMGIKTKPANEKSRDPAYWHEALPEQLLSTLEAFERVSAEAAALAFLEKRGYKVELPK